jgi:hypothetical protein
MKLKYTRRLLSWALLALAAGCSSQSPAVPSSSTAAGSSPASGSLLGVQSTGSITVARSLLPANNALITYQSQPVTLVVANALATKPGDSTYTFQVATDAAFTTIVQTKDGVAEGSGGQTSVRLDSLTGARDYYWHVRATSAGTTGVFNAPFKFTVGPAITISTPLPIAPLNGTHTVLRPALRVTNVARQGPAGTITYKFEISTVSTFASILAGAPVAEGVVETGFIPPSDLPTGVTLFWRATAIDAANTVTSASSVVQSFIPDKPSQASVKAAQLGEVLWPGVQPPGTVGHATMGRNWDVGPIVSPALGVTYMNPPMDQLRIFDLLDRGFEPPDAVDWMHANGYPDAGLWYPVPGVIAFQYAYMALVDGLWENIIRVGG